LDRLWQSTDTKVLNLAGRKYVIISDLHLGDGGSADDFRENEMCLAVALDYYRQRDYHLILLGDVEEFWQFDLDSIRRRYDSTIYCRMREFGDDRVHRVFGNHDIDWAAYPDPAKNHPLPVVGAVEAIKLRNASGKAPILLTHGHQGSLDSDKNSWLSRAGVHFFAKFESAARFLGLYGQSTATKSMIATDYERIMYSWALKNKAILICGHSHRAIFASRSHCEEMRAKAGQLQSALRLADISKKREMEIRGELQSVYRKIWAEESRGRCIAPADRSGNPRPCYFNTGCCIYSDGLTAIEIANEMISLVKWPRDAGPTTTPAIFKRERVRNIVESL
jgi:UDP-2,3-diacylglucosamine pyrophosphatase LpxH